jgi:proteasome assembly chaperone (PAC2) family protein
MVELVEGSTRKVTWPSNEFMAARLPEAKHDIIVLLGTEPSLKWRTFSSVVIEEAKRHQVSFVITLGALLADVPHSRPVPITGTAISEELIERLQLQRSRYEGPTGIVGVLHTACANAGIESASLWAAVPHYISVTPNPKAALALVGKATDLIGVPADVSDLERASTSYEERVSDMVASDDDVQAYVRMLEERLDDRDAIDSSELPSGDALAAELEQFLQERDPGQD